MKEITIEWNCHRIGNQHRSRHTMNNIGNHIYRDNSPTTIWPTASNFLSAQYIYLCSCDLFYRTQHYKAPKLDLMGVTQQALYAPPSHHISVIHLSIEPFYVHAVSFFMGYFLKTRCMSFLKTPKLLSKSCYTVFVVAVVHQTFLVESDVKFTQVHQI